jgi:hypothetical protein
MSLPGAVILLWEGVRGPRLRENVS